MHQRGYRKPLSTYIIIPLFSNWTACYRVSAEFLKLSSLGFNNISPLWKHLKKTIMNNIIFYRELVTRNSSVFRRNIDNINIIALLQYNIVYLFIFRSQLTSIGDLLGLQVYTIISGSTALT